MVAFMLQSQRPRGHWTTGNRPPLEESNVTVTVLAASGIERFASPSQRGAAEAAVGKAKNWLVDAPVKMQEDRTSKLWGLVRFGADAGAVARARAAVLDSQRNDGGWASADGLPSDAYATGQTLARLR